MNIESVATRVTQSTWDDCEMQKNERAEQSADAETARSRIGVTTLLRRVGGLVLVCSALSFLLQRWVGMDSMFRYGSFLGFTLILSGLGLFCALVLREDKGARTFLTIAACFLPAHFTQLGALLYSVFLKNHQAQFAGQSEYVRNLAIYQAPSAMIAAATTLLATAVLIPIVYTGFASIARNQARRLTMVYFAANALLLVPSRHPLIAAALALLGVLALEVFDSRVLRTHSAMKTMEGVGIRLLLFIAPLIVLGRNMLLYPQSWAMSSAAYALVGYGLFRVLPRLMTSERAGEALQLTATIPIFAAWAFAADGLFLDRHALWPISNDFELSVYTIPASVVIGILSIGARREGRILRIVAVCAAVSATVTQLLFVGGAVNSLICVATSIAVLVVACVQEERALFKWGTVGLGVGLLYHLRYASELFSVSPWLCLAILGALTVMVASVIEAHHGRLLSQVAAIRQRFAHWS
jgi:hypothetical protein